MRCEFCQGRGKFWFYPYGAWEPCNDCGGFGEVSCCEGSERYGQLPNVEIKVTPIEKLLDDVIDSTFMKQGFKPSQHRKAILEALEGAGYKIVKKEMTDDSTRQVQSNTEESR